MYCPLLLLLLLLLTGVPEASILQPMETVGTVQKQYKEYQSQMQRA